jgi:Caspase domain/Domain of unknown function (DUF4384)
MKPRLRAAWIWAAVALMGVPAPASELRAIVVGFNKYQNLQKLLGAEADAVDIAAVLRKRGVHDLVIMSDPGETTEDFRAEWSAMTARAAPGDTMMLTFAGHGMRVPEMRTPKRTPDGYDKGFLFPTYDQDAHPDELLRDEDLYDLFKATAAKDIRILFVVDACHAGSGIRGNYPSAPVRFQRFDLRGSDPPRPPPVAIPPRPPIDSVAVITAQIQEKAISEISVDGVNRGALSYAIARGLEGAADTDGTGVITVEKLWNYIRPIVRTRSSFNQAPGLFAVAADSAMPILSASPTPAMHDELHPGLPELRSVKLFQLGATAGEAPLHTTLVEDKFKAELVYDSKERLVLDSAGDTLAVNVDHADVEAAVKTRQLLNALETLADREGALNMSLSAGDGLYVKGARVRVQVDSEPFNYLTVLDFAANGQMTLLYPLADPRFHDSLESHSSEPLPPIKVDEPFGADYVVAIRSEKPLESLLGSFSREKDYHLPVAEGAKALRRSLVGVALRIGVQGVYTCKQLIEEGQCKPMAASSP